MTCILHIDRAPSKPVLREAASISQVPLKSGYRIPSRIKSTVYRRITGLSGIMVLLLISMSACADGVAGNAPEIVANDSTALIKIEQRTPDPAIRKLVKKIDAIRQEHGVAAVGLAVVSTHHVLYVGASGVKDWQSKEAVDEHTGFRLGSITKSFTGITALRLQRKYPQLLAQDMNSLVPGLLDDPYSNDAITIAHLLEHTAGLSDLSKSEFDVQDGTISYVDAVKVDSRTRQLRWPPGQHSSYSNAGYGLAGYALELISEQPFEQLVHEQVLGPLGMKHTGFQIDHSGPALAQGYDRDGRTVIPYWQMIYRSFGALDTTPADMAIYLQALLQSPVKSNLSESTKPLLFNTEQERQRYENPATTLAAKTGLDYGYGLGNYHWYSNGARFHGHGGDADGYLSHYAYQSDAGLAYFVVITAFNHTPLRQMRDELEAFIAAKVTPRKATQVTLNRSQLERWVGQYEAVTQRFGSPGRSNKLLQVRLRRGQLETVMGRDVKKLVPVSGHLFRRPWQPAASYAFIEADDQTYLQGDIGNFRRLRPTG